MSRPYEPLARDRAMFEPLPADPLERSRRLGRPAVKSLQTLLNAARWESDPRLEVDGGFGPLTEAQYRRWCARRFPSSDPRNSSAPVRVDAVAWGLLQRDAWGCTAWVPVGTNRHTGAPVNVRGLTFDTARLENLVSVLFPEHAFTRNVMVDRNARGTNRLSDHAKGQALDLMTWYLPARGYDFGTRVFEWLAAHPRELSPYGVRYALFNGRAWYLGTDPAPRPMAPTTDPHRTHIHISLYLRTWVRP